jgi:hypothetical protein
MPLARTASYLVISVVVTIPLLFGARHPVVEGFFTFVILVGCGGWLVLAMPSYRGHILLPWLFIPLLLVAYLVAQSLPLPLSIIELISPQRADRIAMVNELAGTAHIRVSISDNGLYGFYRSFFLIALILFFFTTLSLFRDNERFLKTLAFSIVAVGVFEAMYGIVQFLKPEIGILWLQLTAGRAAHGTIIYKNQFASLLNMIWPLAITVGALYFIDPSSRSRDASGVIKTSAGLSTLLLFGGGAMIVAVLFSLSRGGILSMTLTAALLAFVLPFSIRGKVKFFTVFGLFILGYVLMLGIDTIIDRFATMPDSGATRLDLYRYSLRMLGDHWLTGIGMGSFSLLSPIYLHGFPEQIHFTRAHNEYLELFIELGIPMALLLFSWVGIGMGFLFFQLIKNPRRSRRVRADSAIAAACLCGLFSFLFHGIADFGWRLPVNLIYALTLLAIAIHCLSRVKTDEDEI